MAYGTVNVDAMTTSDGVTSAGTYGFKNRIINGAMVIDQRNAGASTSLGSAAYKLDRWVGRADTGSGNTIQQSTTAPSGFSRSTLITIGTGASPTTSQRNYFQQVIEGYNFSDMAFGTASSSPITISFRVRCSLTGTFGGAIQNQNSDRSYPFTYTISSANTWETKSVTIAGDTTGTWTEVTNGAALYVNFDLGSGATFQGTAGAWAAADYRAASGCVQLVGTSGATFYITGVQLEKGSTATSFDYRPYGTELALCQRYFAKIYGADSVYIAAKYTTSKLYTTFTLPVTPRATPSVTIPSGTYYAADYNFANSDSNPSISSVDTTEFGSNVNVIWNISWNPASNYIFRVGSNTASNLFFSMEL
jgi:hypothetical protein